MKVELVAITPNAEEVIENAGRTCYQSVARENYKVGTLIKALIKSGHESVLEHAYGTFRINGVSRAMTHQLVRHRLMAISQQSQRYVKEDQFEYVIPKSVMLLDLAVDDPCDTDAEDDFKNDMSIIQAMYDKWKARGLKNEDARFVLPNACQSEIVISANFREMRHIFEVRCDKHAQWEIRAAANKMLSILHGEAPSVFEDLFERFIGKADSK